MSNSIEIRISSFDPTRISIIATRRKLRPKQYSVSKVETKDVYCPFCPGREYDTPPAVLVLNKELKFTKDSDSIRIRDWFVRIFPNKYPALTKDVDNVRRGEYSIYGYHEVLVESPLHNENEYLKNVDHAYYALKALRKRVEDILNDPRIEYVMVIKNSGARAGASIRHPHLQLFANTFTPPQIKNEIEGFRKYFSTHGKCPLCELVKEISPRTVIDSKYFRVETRYAPKQSYELLIVPKRHSKDFLDSSDEELRDLALVLNSVITGLRKLFGEIDYNYWFHIAPKDIGDKEFHWHIEIQPLIETWGGYEKSSGVHIVTTKPEDAAEELRKMLSV